MKLNLSAHPFLYWFIPVIAVSALMLGIWSGFREFGMPQDGSEAVPISATLIPNPRPLQPFSLSRHSGEEFAQDTLLDNWTFIAFGYTHCPDICPTTLSVLSQTADLVNEDTAQKGPQFVFVSVDPERDSLQRLATYVPYFNPDFIGATGPEADLQRLTGQLGILYRKVEDENTALDYLVDHSASIVLIDPLGRLQAVFSPPHDAGKMAQDFRVIEHNYRP
jgi:protein SCO1/2